VWSRLRKYRSSNRRKTIKLVFIGWLRPVELFASRRLFFRRSPFALLFRRSPFALLFRRSPFALLLLSFYFAMTRLWEEDDDVELGVDFCLGQQNCLNQAFGA